METMNYCHVVLRAPNDVNGNPRRLSLLVRLDAGGIQDVIDHGYRGAPRGGPWGSVVLDLRVSAKVYNEHKREVQP